MQQILLKEIVIYYQKLLLYNLKLSILFSKYTLSGLCLYGSELIFYLLIGVLLDILQRTGLKGYEAFLESLELDYPDVYRKITGKEPARVFSVLIGKLNIFN